MEDGEQDRSYWGFDWYKQHKYTSGGQQGGHIASKYAAVSQTADS